MAGLCFYFEPVDVDVWSGRDLDAWNYAAKAAGDIDKIIVVNLTDQIIQSPDAGLKDFQVVTVFPVLANAVFLVGPQQASGAESLWAFDHEVDWYCFGPATGWSDVDTYRKLHIPQANVGALHSVHIASVVMMHRYSVRGV